MTWVRPLVIIPTYNEAENIERILRRIAESLPGAGVLVVDDGSPDGTGDLVKSVAAELPDVHLMARPGKSGLGSAYRAGNRYAPLVLGLNVSDSTAGFRAYSAAILRMLDLEAIRAEGYGFQIEMTYRAKQQGAKIKEVPITFVDRVAGESKMSSRIVFEALVLVTWWGLGRATRGIRRPTPGERVQRSAPGHLEGAMATAELPLPRILVVDDEPNIAELLSVALRFEGYDVASAMTGADALDMART